jgi:hypothetical protein
MEFADFIVDGVRIADTDFSQFTRGCHLEAWQKRAKAVALEIIGKDDEDRLWDFGTYRGDLAEPTRSRLIDEQHARASSMPSRNLDLIVVRTFPKDWLPSDIEGNEERFSLGDNDGRSPSNIRLMAFTEAEQMSNYEFAAYEILGAEECDRQGIDTLHDMFGTEFATAFYKRKTQLIAKADLVEAYAERDKLNERIAELEELARG